MASEAEGTTIHGAKVAPWKPKVLFVVDFLGAVTGMLVVITGTHTQRVARSGIPESGIGIDVRTRAPALVARHPRTA